MSTTINKDREFRRGRWNDYLGRTVERYRKLEGREISRPRSTTSAPVGATLEHWSAYVKWKNELIDYIKAKRKDCR